MSAPTVEQVELVNRDGSACGTSPKFDAHVAPGRLHRAVSVLIFDGDDSTLLQRRAADAYHFANQWTNTCCTHPRPGEDPAATARRRLTEEMGISLEVTEVGTFRYRAEDPVSGLVEDEYDHVFVGLFTGSPRPDSELVSDWEWVPVATLQQQLAVDAASYTPWLPTVLDMCSKAISGVCPGE